MGGASLHDREIDVEQSFPGVAVFPGLSGIVPHTGIVHQQRDLAEGAECPVGETIDLIGFRNVRCNGKHGVVAGNGRDGAGGIVKARATDVCEHDLHAHQRKPLCGCQTDAAGGAGDDGGIAGAKRGQGALDFSVGDHEQQHPFFDGAELSAGTGLRKPSSARVRVDQSGRDRACCPTNGDFRLTDWIAILKEQTATGDQMGREVPQMLANPDISEAQVKTLFAALEKQAEFVEKLRMALEKFGHDFSIIKAAERLEERYADLAASVAEKLKAMRK